MTDLNNLLEQKDYQLITPDSGVQPLDLIVRDKLSFFKRLFVTSTEGSLVGSKLSEVFKPTSRTNYPKIKSSKRGDHNGIDILDAKLNFVKKIMAVGKGAMNAAQMDKILFHYKNTQRRGVSQVAIDEYINYAHVAEGTSYYDRARNGDIYVITDVLRSDDMNFYNGNDFKFEGKIETDELNKLFHQLKADGGLEQKLVRQVKETGSPKTFAIKIAQITYSNDKYAVDPARLNVRGEGNEDGVIRGEGSEIVFLDN